MTIYLRNVLLRLPELRFSKTVNWVINEGQQWAVIGPNGAGKSLLVDILQRKYAIKEGEIGTDIEGKWNELVKSIAFKDIYSLADCRNAYYQQRWHSTETEEVPLVSELLKGYEDDEQLKQLLSFFGIEDLLSKRLIFLSSGELRKFLIVRSMISCPRLLILDNPFIGLDAASRQLLVDMLRQMTELKTVQIVLLLSYPQDIPDMVTHVLPVMGKTLYPVQSRQQFLADNTLQSCLFPVLDKGKPVTELPVIAGQPSRHEVTLRMDNVSIRYGNRTILKDLSWEVKNGEKWALSGPNGSGKSTLLSLVYADNPQSYANTIYLFDRKRGSGESIWEIKRRIGYVSPEMHLYYRQNVPGLQIVASGFFDSIGLYRKCNAEQESRALLWMEVFQVTHLKDRLFLTLSSGEQRLILLARAFVKDPDLLIMDEPLHGLDIHNKKRVTNIIQQFCSRDGKTLIYVTHYLNELPPIITKRFDLIKQKQTV